MVSYPKHVFCARSGLNQKLQAFQYDVFCEFSKRIRPKSERLIQLKLFLHQRFPTENARSLRLCARFTQKLNGEDIMIHRTRKKYFSKIYAAWRRIFAFSCENSQKRMKALQVNGTNFLLLTIVWNEEPLIPANMCREESKIETGHLSKRVHLWKNRCFWGFFDIIPNKKISPIPIFWKLFV